MTAAHIIVPLMIADRCDHSECEAEARVRVQCGRLFLDFCAHHYGDHADALLFAGWTVNDDTRAELLKRTTDPE